MAWNHIGHTRIGQEAGKKRWQSRPKTFIEVLTRKNRQDRVGAMNKFRIG